MRTSSGQRAWDLRTHGWAAQSECERSATMVRGTWGQYVAVSLSPTHLSHTRNINPFENKVWEVYFYKEVCSFVNWICHHVSAYICMYMSIHHKEGHKIYVILYWKQIYTTSNGHSDEFISWMRLFALHIALEKRMNPTILPSTMGR